MSKAWEQMEALLFEAGAQGLWQRVGERHEHTIECWMVGRRIVLFVRYAGDRGFEVFTRDGAPGEIDKIIPWLLEGDDQ